MIGDFVAEVFLRDTKTGKTGSYWTHVSIDENGTFQDYNWTEGNYSCDHNRVLFLYGHQSPEADSDEFDCQSSRILIEKIVLEGRVVYSETKHPGAR